MRLCIFILIFVAIVAAMIMSHHQQEQTAILLRIAKAQEATLAVLKRGVRTEIDWSIPMELPPVMAEKGE